MRGLISREEPEPPEGGELPVLRESRGGTGVRGKGVRSVGGAEHHASARLPSVTIKGDAFLSIFTDEETEALRTQ